VLLEIEVQGARQVRAAMPEAVLVFIAPPDPEALRERLEGRGTDTPEAIDERLRTAESELAAQQEFQHVVVNDDVDRAAEELARIVRAELARD
jgi:guanylate kinase